MTNRQVLEELIKTWNSPDMTFFPFDPQEMARLFKLEKEHPELMDQEYQGEIITPDKMTEEMKQARIKWLNEHPVL